MLLEVMVAVVVVMVSLRVYCTVTAGRCTSTRSMAGKTVIITGATAGIGKETARDLLRRGARVIIACRNLEKAARVAGELRADMGGSGEVVIRHLDTSNLDSVRTFAKEVLDSEKAIHVLINNAGILGPDKRQVTSEGLELTMATNHFGHFLLTNLLLARMEESAPSRIINVSSLAHKWAGEDDLENLEPRKYSPWRAYCASKLCNVLFTKELAERMVGTGVTVNSLHPGAVRTDIAAANMNLVKYIIGFCLMGIITKDAETGAQTTIHLAVSEEMEGLTGRYLVDCKEAATSKLVHRKDLAVGLWKASLKAVGLQHHETHC